MSWERWATDEHRRIHDTGRWRTVRDLDGLGPATTLQEPSGPRPVISFAGNDYLDLARHPAVVAAAQEALESSGAGAGAARLLGGARPIHHHLEAALADWKRGEQAVLFSSGYTANLGVLAGLGEAGVRIVSDQANHASIVDGCRLSRAEVVVFPHGDVGAADQALRGAGRAVVVSESVFSMDGDVADVDGLAEVCRRHDALLVLDEAHGVLGPELLTTTNTSGPLALRVGTLSKALGGSGGFVTGPARLCGLVVNCARSFIFTTAGPPATAAAALAALAVYRSADGDARRARLRANLDRLAVGHPTPIVPVVLGSEAAASAAAASLLARGFFVPAIRPPTVAPGTSRLRISLSSAHTDRQIDALKEALADVTAATPT